MFFLRFIPSLIAAMTLLVVVRSHREDRTRRIVANGLWLLFITWFDYYVADVFGIGIFFAWSLLYFLEEVGVVTETRKQVFLRAFYRTFFGQRGARWYDRKLAAYEEAKHKLSMKP